MLEQNLQNSYCKSVAALAMSLAVCFVVLLSFQQNAAQSPLNVWRSSGPNASIQTVIVDPFNPNIIYAGGSNGVYKSINNGASWVSLSLEGATDLSVDHINPNTIYAAYNGVYKSTDGGLNWINLNSPAASKIQVSPGDPNFIVAAGFNGNILVTNNGGASWETRPFPPPQLDWGNTFEIDPQDPNNIYACYTWGDWNFLSLRRSNSAGAFWTDFYYPCPFCGPGGVFSSATGSFKVDPNNSNIVYASAINSFSGIVWSLFKSTNGGASWRAQGNLFQTTALAISAQSPRVIYAASYEAARSFDDGATWSAFNDGLPGPPPDNPLVWDLAFDRSGRFLHAATSAGVYSVRVRPNETADFDGDGRSDISVFRPSNGTWYLNQSTNGFSATQFGLSTDKLAPADFDGDGKTDIAVFRDGVWYWLSSSNHFSFNVRQFGIASDIPVPADYTGDGRAELATYRNGAWWTQDLTNNQTQVVNFGLSGDKSVPADYDGDGRCDQAVYRNGEWHLNRSSQGYAVVNFGLATDKPVVADYDGDGRADQAVYRDGTWYLLQSTQGFAAFPFGIASDVSAPADYDGDGRTDAAVYRDGTWYLRQSTNGFSAQQFGLTNDKPVPSAYLP